ncbi:hypothetical protein [Anaerovibrio sp. RM50]|uniref:hypothetical protein n=1 Tax=Anaerovibrio sp. RM50 TaxID=1200557 RepID=UPI0006848FC5|nr:hypothetical protein [Anaerovibrio sp. RM50]
MGIDLFLNDSYKILKLLYDNQTVVLDKKVVPLTQSEIGIALGMSKAKVNVLIGQLQDEDYVSLESRGKYVLSEKAVMFIQTMRRTDTKLIKKKDDK